MILQALKEYYDRKASDPDSGIAPNGWEWKEIPFVLVLDDRGVLLNIEDTREGEGKNRRAKRFLVPQGVKKTSGIVANLLWDSSNYIFGFGDRGNKEKNAFIAHIKDNIRASVSRDAILAFLENSDQATIEKQSNWLDIKEAKQKPLVSFRFHTDNELYCQSNEIKAAIAEKLAPQETDGLCLITGQKDKISITHTSIKGVWGAQSSGSNIVSFNRHAFCSFGLRDQQGKNSPIGEKAMFAYTTALNTLLEKNSRQRIQIGDASTVFWSEKKTQMEDDLPLFFSEPAKDNPDANTDAIKALFASPATGAFTESEDEIKFYILGLSPNAARISVRFWKVGTVGEIANNIRQHFTDLAIMKPPNEPLYYSLWRLLVNASVQDKSENIPPNIAGDFMRSIMNAAPYPTTLLQLVLRRIKSDQGNVKPVRAALIKAAINRDIRMHKKTDKKEITMALDTDQPSIGYQLGRLFAVLEKIQEEANPGLNATIREKYYGAACGAPVSVFPTLLRLKNHHLAKLENKGREVNFEKLLGEIASHFDDFPSHLNLHEQGKFAIGYYHQRQNFFVKNETK